MAGFGINTFAIPEGGSPVDSPKKVAKTPRKAKKQNAKQAKGDLSISQQVIVANGFQPSPTAPVGDPAVKSADFYRYGKGQTKVGNQTVDVAGGGVNLGQSSSIKYDLVPRMIEEFDDQEASIRLYGKKPGSKEKVDLIPPYTKFILQSAQESYNERSQIVETFGDYYVFFFGQRPVIYNFSGTLFNAKNASWLNDWKFMYQSFLRGTKAVESSARVILSYGGRQIEGYILSTGNQTNSSSEFGVPFNFQLLVIDEKFLHFSNDFGLVLSNGKLSFSNDFLNVLTDSFGGQGDDVDRALQQARAVMNKGKNPLDSSLIKGDQKVAIESEFNTPTDISPTGNLRLATDQAIA